MSEMCRLMAENYVSQTRQPLYSLPNWRSSPPNVFVFHLRYEASLHRLWGYVASPRHPNHSTRRAIRHCVRGLVGLSSDSGSLHTTVLYPGISNQGRAPLDQDGD